MPIYNRKIPSKDQIEKELNENNNWGRWEDKSGYGAINLINEQKRIEALKVVEYGKSISLSRPLPVSPSDENPYPVQHYMSKIYRGDTGVGAVDYIGMNYHGQASTHIDALCHVWNEHGMWNGENPEEVIDYSGSKYGGIEAWEDGILTRGILLDVPRHRKKKYVEDGSPVHGWELEDIVASHDLAITPGDAILVYSGREEFNRNNQVNWGGNKLKRPGLHASCLPFIRDNNISLLGWDMMDERPNEYGLPWTVHGAIFAYGIALLDNALLEPLSSLCHELNKYEFMLSVNPLKIVGGTGSPVNPIVVL
ncbi:MAG: hypothetical protein CL904_02045 [Dehalococcoidia bacterium]|nr:hypothetical protein [Dehalococcoidia bacterium]MQG16621.1 cyclase family protein [SAR202 cluster bacterium]|tara:strand:+ start:463 stop:1389 length:927 start_codon:yes stop_codon:yes gene_type:complete